MTTTSTEKPARQSKAARAAAQAEQDAIKAAEAGEIEPTTEAVEQAAAEATADQQQPEQPDSEQQSDAAEQPKPPKPPTATERRAAIFTALLRVAGDLLDRWDDDDSPAIEARDLGVTAEEARATIAHRMSYIPSALDKVWDSRLGPVPTGRGKIPSGDGGQ